MKAEIQRTLVTSLEKARGELQMLAKATESGVASVAKAFERLTVQTDAIISLAASIVGSVEDENTTSVLPQVQSLGAAARKSIGDKLQATSGILEMVTKEGELLRQLSSVTRGQVGVAVETKALSVLTNIEVGRLGVEGDGFQYLAHELAGFSKSVTQDILELMNHINLQRTAMEETKRAGAGELPRQREEMAHIQTDLGNALGAVHTNLSQLSQTPTQFRVSVEQVAQQVAGVVAALQAHDITRQQIEHVDEAFAFIAGAPAEGADGKAESAQGFATAHAGLSIQVYQLRAIKETVASWISQIKACMDGILRVSTSDMVGIGPMVLEQEHEMAAQLAHIEALERQSAVHGERVQRILEGLTTLMQLVRDHLRRSKSVRRHLQLLTFNSIIEASRLGRQAAAILAIAESIKGVSTEWGRLTDQSQFAMEEVAGLVQQTREVIGAFSPAGNEKLNEARTQTDVGLGSLRNVAAFAARQAQDMKAATENMQAETATIRTTVNLLESSLGRIDVVLGNIEQVRGRLENEYPDVKAGYDAAELERLFSASYTTETEREILRAALQGADLPAAAVALNGNSVELF